MDFICSKNPTVWDGKGFTPCFADMVLGFGGNVVTVVAVLVLFFTKHNASWNLNIRKGLLEKVFLHIVPAFGACLSFYELNLLLRKCLEGHNAESHEWFIRCSQFVDWMVIVLISFYEYWFDIFCNPLLCFWWILKPLLEIPHLQYKFSLLECLHISLAERSKFSEGEVQTFMSVDADRTINLCNSLHDVWRYEDFFYLCISNQILYKLLNEILSF
ncbi:ABC transporter C family member 13-like isoform X2 [Typha latifolia]|uniref:ABC transporter C family member 13-like isoform X2 n=1 Tax=Typha latifolia TaxID=4733 RepID=UPI003C2AEEE3